MFFEVKGGFIWYGLWYHVHLGGQQGYLLSNYLKEYVDEEFKVNGGKYPDAEDAEAS